MHRQSEFCTRKRVVVEQGAICERLRVCVFKECSLIRILLFVAFDLLGSAYSAWPPVKLLCESHERGDEEGNYDKYV